MVLHQKSLAELEAEAYEAMKGFEKYVPSERDKSIGKWAIVAERLDADGYRVSGTPNHVMPTFGTTHYITDRCWCGPRIDDYGVVIHEASQ